MYYLTTFCCFCLKEKENLINLSQRNFRNVKIVNKLQFCVKPDLNTSKGPIFICLKCWIKLEETYEFKKTSLENFSLFQGYVQQLQYSNPNCETKFDSHRNNEREEFLGGDFETAETQQLVIKDELARIEQRSEDCSVEGLKNNDLSIKTLPQPTSNETFLESMKFNFKKTDLRFYQTNKNSIINEETEEVKQEVETTDEFSEYCPADKRPLKIRDGTTQELNCLNSSSGTSKQFPFIFVKTEENLNINYYSENISAIEVEEDQKLSEKNSNIQLTKISPPEELCEMPDDCVNSKTKDDEPVSSTPSEEERDENSDDESAQSPESFREKICVKQFAKKEQTPHSCPDCGKSFKLKGHLTIHMFIHSHAGPFNCSLCDKKFSTKKYLIAHQWCHTNNRPYSCVTCSKNFKKKSYLIKHQRRHSDNGPYSCITCDKYFKFKSHLTRHKIRLHGDFRPYHCHLCDKIFKTKDDLTAHQRCHSDDRPYSCATCGKNFKLKHHLSHHIRVHTDY